MSIGCFAEFQIAWHTWTWGDILPHQTLGLSVAESLAVLVAFGTWRTCIAHSVSSHYLCWRTSNPWQGNHLNNSHELPLRFSKHTFSYKCTSEKWKMCNCHWHSSQSARRMSRISLLLMNWNTSSEAAWMRWLTKVGVWLLDHAPVAFVCELVWHVILPDQPDWS